MMTRVTLIGRGVLAVLVVALLGGERAAPPVAAAQPPSAQGCATGADEPADLQLVREAFELLYLFYVAEVNPRDILGDAAAAARAEGARGAATGLPRGLALPAGPLAAVWGAFAAEYCEVRASVADSILPTSLAHAAIQAMTAALDEPHTYFLTARPTSTAPPDGFIAARPCFGLENRHLIEWLIPGSSADNAGLRAGDEIVAIDGQELRLLAASDAMALYVGTAGSVANVTVLRPAEPRTHEVEVRREALAIPAVEWREIGRAGYLRIGSFDAAGLGGFPEAQRALSAFRTQAVDGLILDLRGNPGGIAGIANRFAGLFLPQGTILYRQTGPAGDRLVTVAQSADVWSEPIVVLVDRRTGSGAEFLAAALQEHGSLVLGEATGGFYGFSALFRLADRSTLSVTVADATSGEGRALNRVGVPPDEPVASRAPGVCADPPLDRAREILQGS